MTCGNRGDLLPWMLEVRDWFVSWGWSEVWAAVGAIAVGVVLASLLGELVRIVGKAALSRLAEPKQKWLTALERGRVLRGLGWVVVVLITETLVTPVLKPWPKADAFADTFFDAALVIAVTIAISRTISAIVTALETREGNRQRLPFKVLGQAGQIVLWSYATIVFVSVLSHRDVTTLLTGLTAVGAVLVYVFRDPILGWTAGVQIAANDLARIGDWITVPDHDADGYVIEIALTTIKVRNWDKTISTIPSYALVSTGFRNWRGMYEAGGRRIKRSVAIDASSVRACDDEFLAGLDSEGLRASTSGSEETNLSCFRHWLEGWLLEHPDLHHAMTTMVRELAPEGRGVPVEIYAFSKDTSWVPYEHLQADIYDRVLAMAPKFGLRVYQEPSGEDVRYLGSFSPGRDEA